MSQRKHTKKALITAAVSIGLCIAMLFGTTLAWFSDNSAGSRNKFVAGNLDVALYNTTGDTEALVHPDAPLFGTAARWEPGQVKYVNLRVDNTGTLALKYQLGIRIAEEKGSINVFGEKFFLSDFMHYAVVPGRQTYTDDEAGRQAAIAAAEQAGAAPISQSPLSQDGFLCAKGQDTDTASSKNEMTLIVYMVQDNENRANVRKGEEEPVLDLGVTLSATQAPSEQDSFDDGYDQDAGIVAVTPETAQAALDAADFGETLYLAPGNYGTLYLDQAKETSLVRDRQYSRTLENVSIVGQAGVIIDGIQFKTGHIYGEGTNPVNGQPLNGTANSYYSTLHIKNLTIEKVALTKSIYIGADTSSFLNLDGLTVRDCSYTGTDRTHNDKTNKLLHIAGGENYMRNILVENCTVHTAFQGIYTYGNRDIVVRGCTFDNLGHNAVAIQDASPDQGATIYNGGTILIEGNKISQVSDRVFRVGNFREGSIRFVNNSITASGDASDSANPIYKATSVAAGAEVSFTGNTVDGAEWAG